ncbi:type 2 periplasmic-binding domain-containing protein [Occallatibacter riparius]|uniref:Phosphate ABC transporter substrate-binding protein n=1 Tax=Occallatibacter riparius TaxID=1002689 RepID=A0A9J7BVZ5_9BACT|nr:hypothetical protein [Occallatibacter riparius]UWZ86879.1 hypothetical protein MOP44_13235 [Occallatibacter riparius]
MKSLIRCALLISAAILCSSAGYGQVLVVANPSVAADSVSKSELRNVFTGATTKLKDGSKVKPVLLKQGPTHAAFVTGDLSLSEVALLVSWRGLVFSGQGVMPKTFDSESALVAFIAETPGAIGYINPSTPHGNVKILSLK